MRYLLRCGYSPPKNLSPRVSGPGHTPGLFLWAKEKPAHSRARSRILCIFARIQAWTAGGNPWLCTTIGGVPGGSLYFRQPGGRPRGRLGGVSGIFQTPFLSAGCVPARYCRGVISGLRKRSLRRHSQKRLPVRGQSLLAARRPTSGGGPQP